MNSVNELKGMAWGKIPNNFINKILPIKNLESEPELTAFATPKQKKNKLRNIFKILCRF